MEPITIQRLKELCEEQIAHWRWDKVVCGLFNYEDSDYTLLQDWFIADETEKENVTYLDNVWKQWLDIDDIVLLR